MSDIAMGQKGYEYPHWIHLKSHNCLGPYKTQTLTKDHVHSKIQHSISHSYVNSVIREIKIKTFVTGETHTQKLTHSPRMWRRNQQQEDGTSLLEVISLSFPR